MSPERNRPGGPSGEGGGTVLTKKLSPGVSRGAILRGAAEAFDRAGYSGTSLSDVVAQAGVTKGALYFHFTSKEEIARAVIAEQRAWPSADPGVPGLEAVIGLCRRLAGQLTTDP